MAERARAVGIAVVEGPTIASRVTGVSESTIRGWMDEPQFAELRDRKQEVVEAEWDVGVQLGFRRAVELLDKTDDPVKAATAAAIMYDKLALRRGHVTSRTETRTWTDGLDPDKQRRLRDWALDKLDELEDVPDGAAERTGVREPATG
jgi:hypothetical protein